MGKGNAYITDFELFAWETIATESPLGIDRTPALAKHEKWMLNRGLNGDLKERKTYFTLAKFTFPPPCYAF